VLTVSIKKQLDHFPLNVEFEAGQGVTGLLGSSGCGKSMTLKCIAGIESPDSGSIVLDGRVLFDSKKKINLTPQERRIGYLFQNYALFPNMTVAQNIAAGAREKDKRLRRARAERLIESFYLTGMEDKLPRRLSGGQQQRVALARILAGDPNILMLDEPFSALDSYLKWQVELELMDLLAPFPGTVLLVTHNRKEVYRLCQSVCVLDQGRSEPPQPVEQLFETPSTLSALLLSGCKNFSRAQPLPDGRIHAADWGVDLTPSRPLPPQLTHVGYRSHLITPADGPGANNVNCRVLRVVEEPLSTVVILATPGGGQGRAQLHMDLPKQTWRALHAPETLWVNLSEDHLLLLRE